MAWAKGTATDFIDFARKLRDYAAGVIDPAVHATINSGGQVPLLERWEILTNGSLQPSMPSSGFATDGEIYLKGPGSDPDDEIIVGIKTYRNVGANIFGWEMRGATAFDDSLIFSNLPGVSPPVYAAFDDATFNVFFWVTARRIMAIARIGTTDILIHLGFIQQFGTRSQYPYPLLIGGSVETKEMSFQTGHFSHSCLPDPCNLGAQLRWVDGTWDHFHNYNYNTDQRSLGRNDGPNVIWPHRDPTTFLTPSIDRSPVGGEAGLFEQWIVNQSLLLSPSEIGIYELFPAILTKSTGNVGVIDGVYVIVGAGLVSGDTVTVDSVVYDIFKNTWRGEPIDFFAIRRT